MNGVDGFVLSLSGLINNLFGSMESAAEVLVGFSTTLAGIGCVVYIASIILPAIERVDRIPIYPLLKPLFVAFVVVNFPMLAGVVSDASTGVGEVISSMVTSDDAASYLTLFAEKVDKVMEEQELAQDSALNGGVDSSSAGSEGNTDGSDEAMNVFEKVGFKILYKFIVPGAASLAILLGQVIYIGMLLFSKFFLFILTIVGPLSFALSQFKIFAGSFSQWLARFISVSLWPGLCGIVRGVNDHIIKAIADNMGNTFTAAIVGLVLIIFCATLYLHVPTLADFVVQSGGIGNVGSSAKNVIKSGLKKLMR